ncbi:MAG: molybdopterin molybdotransferase MoeA [Conexivisphaerales archaeon]
MRSDISKYLKLTDYEEALKLAISSMPIIEPESINATQAIGRVAAEDISSRINIPEFDIAMMDGYAVRSGDLSEASIERPVELNIVDSPALSGYHAKYVTTGSPIPEGFDAVAKIEDTRLLGDKIQISSAIPKFKNILKKGEDIQKERIVIKEGEVFNAACISLLLFEGINRVKVKRRIRIGILSVGRELKKAQKTDKRRIFNNYAYLVFHYLKEIGAEAHLLGVLEDEAKTLSSFFQREIESYDMLITLGRSSVGLNDLMLNLLLSLNAETVFHGVKLLPARPTGLVKLKGKLIWMLPAHVISSAVALFSLVIPSISAAYSTYKERLSCEIASHLSTSIENKRFLPSAHMLKLERRGNYILAHPLRWGSNLLSSLLDANAYTILAPRQSIKAGEEIKVTLLGPNELFRIAGV